MERMTQEQSINWNRGFRELQLIGAECVAVVDLLPEDIPPAVKQSMRDMTPEEAEEIERLLARLGPDS